MKKTSSVVAMLFVILSFAFSLRAQSTPDANSGSEFARWQELKEGQEGYMLTVLQGTKIVKIRVKYIGVTPHPASESEKAIVVELADRNIPKDATAVAGTSGSPAYFEVRGQHRIAGATAFMFNDFPKNGTIMGVTPIEVMISGQVAAALKNKLELPSVIRDSKLGLLRITWLPIYLDRQSLVSADGQKAQTSRRPEPGDSVTVVFPGSGGGICTVTYVRGDRYWACGHGILRGSYGEQQTAFQSYRTRITMTLFSAKDSYKLFDRNLEFFGTIVKNTSFAIEGKIHEYGRQP